MPIETKLSASGTSAAAKLFAVAALVAPTMGNASTLLEQGLHQVDARQVTRRTSTYILLADDKYTHSIFPQSATLAASSGYNDTLHRIAFRPTVWTDEVVGEFRSWALLKSNWDGEGATAPSENSIKEAVAFTRLLTSINPIPEPMLLASGNASLFWNENKLYAEIEFLGDRRVAYFVKRDGDVHKGVVAFDSQKMPVVFSAIIWS